ncbi:MAG: flagellar basal-body MS-ring/collar protein FliF, partial [Parvularcula sp.]|nr:flagellar basal-body MS-ring/collar protein FliF [Parvularcula sp.]
MENIVQKFKDLGANRLMVAGAVGAAVIAALVAIIFAFSKPQMSVLFAGLSDADAGAVVTELESMDVPVKLSSDGQTIYAPSGRVPRLRMLMAEKGMPAGGTVGYELFDEKGSLGLTSFMQDMTRLRAMEGELARTIQTLESVESARVHLVMARRDPFSREKAEPTASVVVRMRGARTLDADQAASIKHLVASAVPSLNPGKVSVLDARMGAVFAEENGPMAGAASVSGLQADIENRLALAAESVLTPHLGPGKVRVRVAADLRTEREVRREERFDPKETALRSRQIIDETETSRENATDAPVTVEQNLPESDVGNDGDATATNETERSESVVNYEISSVRSEQVIEPGDVERLSVSVVVDNKRIVGENGEISFVPRTDAELAKLAALVRSAVGFNEARGDVITVENLPFVDLDETMPRFAPATITEVVYRNFDTITQAVALLLIGVALIFGVVRPVIARVMPQTAYSADGEPIAMGELSLDDLNFGEGMDGAEGVAALGGGGQAALPKRSVEQELDQMLELRDVDGKV